MPVICPACAKVNTDAASFCGYCGFALKSESSSTLIVQQQTPTEFPDFTLSADSPLSPEEVRLYIKGYEEPIVVPADRDIILGRVNNDDVPAAADLQFVDLTSFDAHMNGVSRRHAAIRIEQNGYSLEDLGSSNGTAINQLRLHVRERRQLSSGDIIKLGRMILYIQFVSRSSYVSMDVPTATEPVEQEILMLERGDTTDLTRAEGVSVYYLNQHVMPYLNAMMEIQHIIDRSKKRTNAKFDVRTITVNKSRDGIEVKLLSYPEAVYFIRKMLNKWKSFHGRRGIEDKSLELLTASMVIAATGLLDDSQIKAHRDHLTPHVKLICSSSLELT